MNVIFLSLVFLAFVSHMALAVTDYPTSMPTFLTQNAAKMDEYDDDLADAAHSGSTALVSKIIDEIGIPALKAKSKNYGYVSLAGGAYLGHTGVVEVMLTKGEMHIDSASEQTGFTALMWAAAGGYQETVEMLVSRGADTKLKSKDGETAWMIAAKNGHRGVMRYLEQFS